MAQVLNYAEILKQTVRTAAADPPLSQEVKLYSVCDMESGHFLVLATGWVKGYWMDTILFHARLVEQQIFIEEDKFDESLTASLVDSGIPGEHITMSVRAMSEVK